MAKIGIYSGTFDPVHAGHLSFALRATEEAGLEKVYFLPERSPRRKEGVTHYAHRLAMLEIAIQSHERLDTLDLPDKRFTVGRTLPRLKSIFYGNDLSLLVGTDVAELLLLDDPTIAWPGYDILLNTVDLVVGVRQPDRVEHYSKALDKLPCSTRLILTDEYDHSSKSIRSSITAGEDANGLLIELVDYVRQNWLYSTDSISSLE